MKTQKEISPRFSGIRYGKQTASHEKFLLIFLGNVIFIAAANLLTPLFALFVAEVSPVNSASMAGLLWGTFVIATVTFLSILSYCNWFNQRNDVDLLIAGMLLRIAGWSIYIAKPSLESMFCAQLFLGAGEAAGTPAFNALMTEVSIKSKVAPRKLFGMWQVAASLSMALAAVVGGYVVKCGGFRALFLCMIVLASAAVVATAAFRRQLLTIRERHGNDVCVGT